MDLFSFLRGSPERQIRRARKKVKEPHGDPAVRINACRRLYEMGTPEALLALLDRYTISTSPLIRDQEEKEELLSWIVRIDRKAVPSLLTFLKRERQVYWPLRALQEILPSEELAARIDEILRYHWEYPPASSEPKTQLIRSLEEIHSAGLLETVRLFLEDEDDDVCLAAADYLFGRPQEEGRESVLKCYLDAEDRPRVRAQILERLAEHGWKVTGFRAKVEESLPPGYTLSRGGTLRVLGTR